MTDKTVTQADRDRFAEYLEAHGRPATATEMRAGRMDDDDGLLMLARHRLAQTDAQMAAPDELAAQDLAQLEGLAIGLRQRGEKSAAALCDRILASLSASNVMRDALVEAEITFREYERLHLAKNTQDADEKAYRNKQMADKCAAALAGQGTALDRQTVEREGGA